MVVLMVLMGLIVVGMTVAGRSHHDLALRRLETVRSFYVAEAGMNMALREIFLGVDEDGDGGTGTIANNGNPASAVVARRNVLR